MVRWKRWMRKLLIIGLIGSILCNVSFGKAVIATDIYTDKVRYAPGEDVRITLCNDTGFAAVSEITLRIISPDSGLTEETVPVAIDETGNKVLAVWQPPAKDFCGYLLQITTVQMDGSELTFETAVDVSSSWVKFPRYGYLWDYTVDADAEEKVHALNRYHINALQYYDWQYPPPFAFTGGPYKVAGLVRTMDLRKRTASVYQCCQIT